MKHVKAVTPTRVCASCSNEKPIGDFRPWKTESGDTAFEASCLTCSRERSRLNALKYMRVNKGSVSAKRREAYKRKTQGIPPVGRRPGKSKSEVKVSARDRHLRQKYGLTHEKYLAMLEGQFGGCNICGRPPGSRAHMVDHCHKTGRVRGVLCSQCNSGIGMLKDSPHLVSQALIYLLHHETEESLREKTKV